MTFERVSAAAHVFGLFFIILLSKVKESHTIKLLIDAYFK